MMFLRALFPHFTVFGSEILGLGSGNLVSQLVAQNAIIATSSLVFGPLADKCGNRIAIRLLLLIGAVTPALAIGLGAMPGNAGANWFWIIFAFLGFFPVTQKLLTNYLLECVPRERQAQYLGAFSTIQILPLMCSPLIGLAIDKFSYTPAFIGASVAVLLACALTWTLIEPRRHKLDEQDLPKPSDPME